jgi:hypothetical protein
MQFLIYFRLITWCSFEEYTSLKIKVDLSFTFELTGYYKCTHTWKYVSGRTLWRYDTGTGSILGAIGDFAL